MNPQKHGSSPCHNLAESAVKDSATVEERSLPPKDTSWMEAWVKTSRTINALLTMCEDCHSEYASCLVFEQIQEVVIRLAKKGFTLLEVECQRGLPPTTHQSCVPSTSWHSVCMYCPEQQLPHKKEECFLKKATNELQSLHQNQVRIIELLCLYNTIQNAYFTE